MKKLSFIFLISAVIFIQGCDKIDQLRTIDLDADFNKSFNVNITDNDPLTVSETFTLSADSVSKLDKYLSHIKDYTVNKVTYQIKNYSGASAILLSGHLNFGSISYEIKDLDLKAASDSQTVYEVPFDQVALDAIAADLKDGNSVSGTIDGSVTDKPASFEVYIVISVTANAEVI